MKYQEFKRTPHLDEGCALFYRDGTEANGKYHILLPLETIPSFSGDVEEIEYGYTTMASNGLLKGRRSLNSSENDFYWIRDFTNKLLSLKGKQLDLLVILPDYQGYKLRGEVSYRANEITTNELATGTMTITPSWMDEDHIDDVSDLIQETATIVDIDPIINLSLSEFSTTGYVLNLTTEPFTGVTGEVSYSSQGYSSGAASSFVTATFTPVAGTVTKTTLTIKPLEVGREIVKIKTSATDCASWETYITINITE